MEGEEIFSFCKCKANLSPRSKRDSQKHDCVNFYHPCVNHTITRSNMDNEPFEVGQIQEDHVKVLEAPCGDGVWHKKMLPYITCLMFRVAKVHRTFLCYKDNYQANFYWCPCPNLFKDVVLVPLCTLKATRYGFVQMIWIVALAVQSASMHWTNWLFWKLGPFKLKPISPKMKSSFLRKRDLFWIYGS